MENKSKLAVFSSIFMSALALLIIGLEPHIPVIAQMLPESVRQIALIVLPAIIMMARRFNENPPIKVIPTKK